MELTAEARQAEALRRADEFKSVLHSSVSHDLRSPLTAIKAPVDNLRDPAVPWSSEDVAEFLETIESQTDRLIAIVSDLLQMSRLESGTVAVEIAPVQVSALLRDAVQNATRDAEDRELCVEADEALWVASRSWPSASSC